MSKRNDRAIVEVCRFLNVPVEDVREGNRIDRALKAAKLRRERAYIRWLNAHANTLAATFMPSLNRDVYEVTFSKQ